MRFSSPCKPWELLLEIPPFAFIHSPFPACQSVPFVTALTPFSPSVFDVILRIFRH